jgi:DNA-directed RNA polymerase specialized sigma24 family protein
MAAFTTIYETYTERMITWAINILDDREQAMDTAQDVLLWL